jgi:hypothetical protein
MFPARRARLKVNSGRKQLLHRGSYAEQPTVVAIPRHEHQTDR